jgi:trypsin-like peptidase
MRLTELEGTDPRRATGKVIHDSGNAVVGSCTAFRHPHVALTAAHCVVGRENGLSLRFFGRGQSHRVSEMVEHRVTEVVQHKFADIAILWTTPTSDQRAEWAFQHITTDIKLGDPFIAYGFPAAEQSSLGPIPENLEHRLFRGHYQRYFPYEAPRARYRYGAGEMSIAAPAGLSGGPVLLPNDYSTLTGIVTTNFDSYITIDSVEEIIDEGKLRKQEIRKVISYGISLLLSDDAVLHWLNEQVPTLP